MSYLDSDEEEEFVIEYSRCLLPGHLLDTSTEDLDEDVFNISGVSSIESPEGGVDEIPYAPAVIPSGVITPDHRVTQMRRAVSKLCQRLAVDASERGVGYGGGHTFAGEEAEMRDPVNESFGAEGDMKVGPDSVFGAVPEVRSRSAILSRRSGGDVSFDN